MNITIIGSGMAGLIAANMLRRHNVTIWEKAPSLSNNHSAVLRFRTRSVSDATGIPFSHEVVHKGLWKEGRVVNEVTLEDMNRYSLMVTGGHLFNRSILSLEPAERWCAPRDFITQMARNLSINYNVNCGFESQRSHTDKVISTVPMVYMMDILGWRDRPMFRWLPVWTIKVTLDTPIIRVCQTLYQVEPRSWYRATLHGQELTLEFMFEPVEEAVMRNHGGILEALGAFGFRKEHQFKFKAQPTLNKIAMGKILPIDEGVRKRFLLWLTEKHGIYSLGRFATWRNILLDDIVGDVKRIEAMIERGSTYDHR